MKNKTTKTITCLLAGLTLTACVGTVNLGAGTLGTTTEERRELLQEALEERETNRDNWREISGGNVGNVTGNYIIRGGTVGNVDGNVIVKGGRVGDVTGDATVTGGHVGDVGGHLNLKGGSANDVTGDATVQGGHVGDVGGNLILKGGSAGDVTGNATVTGGHVDSVGGYLDLRGGSAGNAGNKDASKIKNLTLVDLPEIPDNAFIIDGFDNTKPIGFCDEVTKLCAGVVPIAIDIEPLNDTNNSTAIYNGDVSVSYFNEAGTIRDITKNIDINVDFDDNEINHSSMIDTNPFSIDGDFNSTGQITGNVTYDTVQGNLIGLIGQTEMIGIFGGKAGGFGGGFKATRQ